MDKADQSGFEAYCTKAGDMPVTPAKEMECWDGRYPATYWNPSTETAWRAWANRPIAAPISEDAGAQTLMPPDCGACPGDGSTCKDNCRFAIESPASPSGSTEQPAAASVGNIAEDEEFMKLLADWYEEIETTSARAVAAKDRLVSRINAWGAQQREAGGIEQVQRYQALHNQHRFRAIVAEKERDDLRAQLLLLKEQASAWLAVAETLGKVVPECWGSYPTGRESAVKAIEELARPADLAGLTRYTCDSCGEYRVSLIGEAYMVTDVQTLFAGK